MAVFSGARSLYTVTQIAPGSVTVTGPDGTDTVSNVETFRFADGDFSFAQLTGPTDGDARIWAMDRAHCGEPGVIALSLSAEGPWLTLNTDALVACCIRNLQTVVGPQVCRWHRVVNVRRATPDATPNACLPPEKRQPMPGLWLCGDWTHPEYPATLEAAVQTGFAVAEKIIRIFSL